MLVFIQNMPESISSEELYRLVGDAVNRSWFPFRRKGSIQNLDIIRLRDPDNRTVEHCGLVDIEPDGSALAAIKKLNRSVMGGGRLSAGPYAIRSTYRDRRGHKSHEEDLSVIDRRRGDRRRQNLIVDKMTDKEVAERNVLDGA